MMEKQELYDELIRRINNPVNFTGRNGIKIKELKEGYARGEMENTPATQNLLGGLHGGALATLADAVCGMAVASLGYARMTIHGTVEYLRVAAPGPVSCEAKVRKAGKTVVVCESVITDSEGREVTLATFSFMILGDNPLMLDTFLDKK